jgi:regulator of sigma E protease
MHEFLVSVLAFIVLVGLMVIVHEFGHFAVAKFFKVRVEAFSFGFGPRLFGFKYGDTDYKVCLLPLGGFVKMTGEMSEQNLETPVRYPGGQLANLPISSLAHKLEKGIGEASDEQPVHDGLPAYDPGAFTSHPRWQRMLIGLAGPFSNFILAFVLMVIYFGWINEVPAIEVKSTTVEWINPGSAAAQAGIEPGDIIQRFDSEDNPTWDKVYERANLNLNQVVPVTVDRDGKTLQLTMRMPAELKGDDVAGMLPQYLQGAIGVQEVQPGTPADKAGLRAGDTIQSVDGHAFHTVSTLLAYMQAGQGKPISLVVMRHGVTLPPLVAHPAKLDTSWKLGFATVPIPFRTEPLGVSKAVTKSTAFCADNSFLIVEVLQRLFTHRVSVTQLAGPVGIARMAGEAAEMKGWYPKFGLAGQISLNLGILNLMPFPILDGGMILLLLIESVLRHDISINVKERIYQAAFVVLMAFFAFVIFNDVTRLPIFTHLKP